MIVSLIRGGITETLFFTDKTGKGYLFNPRDPQGTRVNIEGGIKSFIISPTGSFTPLLPPVLQPKEEKQPLIR
ncbi:MAG: hypothetical protein NT178_15415 [Proteobacteria bacterium]|nr:hypothetical protein [Pseudomonadota bacterium]